MKITTSSRLLKIIQAFIADHPYSFAVKQSVLDSGQLRVGRRILHYSFIRSYYFLNTLPVPI